MLFKIINAIIQMDLILIYFFLQRDTKYKVLPRLLMIVSVILIILPFV